MSETIEDNIQVLFKSAPEGLPTEDNFEIKRAPMPSIGEGQFLLRNLYLSLDPYQRMLMGGGWTYSGGDLKPGDLMVGRILGEVIESKNPDYPVGTAGRRTRSRTAATWISPSHATAKSRSAPIWALRARPGSRRGSGSR